MINSYPLKKNSKPELKELVICKYKSQNEYEIKVDLLEYNLEASLITENIKELKKNKNFVCLVKSINNSLIELTDEVTEDESKNYLNKFIENKFGHNLLISLSKKFNISIKEIYKDFAWEKIEEFGSLKRFFKELSLGLKFDNKYKNDLITLFNKKNNKSLNIKIKASVIIKSPKGVNYLKNCLENILIKNKEIEIHFIKSPNYEISLIGNSLDVIKKELNNSLKCGEDYILKNGGQFDIISLDVLT